MAIIKFGLAETEVKLKYGTGKEVEGLYGKQWQWSCNEDDCFYASEQFNVLLSNLDVKEGDVLKVKKVKKENEGRTFEVFAVQMPNSDNFITLDDISSFRERQEEKREEQASDWTTGLETAEPASSLVEDNLKALTKRVEALESMMSPAGTFNEEDIPA